MKLRLEVVRSAPGAPAVRQELEFTAGPVSVGRAAGGNVVIEGHAVSRVHFTLDTVHGAWHVTHQGSASSTNLNGVALPQGRPTRLADGDRIAVAQYEIRTWLPRETMLPEIQPLRDSFVQRLDEEPPRPVPVAVDAPAPPPRGLGARPGPAGQAVPTFVAYAGLPEQIRLELTEIGKTYVIGRAATCDMTLADNSVSRQHAFVRFDGTLVYVRDAAGRIPLKVNGRPIVGETPLSHGDVVTIGPIDVQFVSEPAASPGSPGTEALSSQRTTVLQTRLPIDDGNRTRAASSADYGTLGAAPAWKPQPAAPAPDAAPSWDAMAQPAGAPSWAPAPPAAPVPPPRAAAPPPPPPPPVAPAATAVPDWSAMSAQEPQRSVVAPAWDVPAPPPPSAPPPAPSWDVPPPAGAGAVPWAGPPPVDLPPPAPPPPAPAPFMAPPPPPPPAPGAPPSSAPPPPGMGGIGAKVVTRRGSSHKGWLIAGVVCMAVAVTLGVIFVMIAVA